MRHFFLSALVVVAMTGCALAGDLPTTKNGPAPVPPPAFSWGGLYVGGDIGGSWGAVRHSFSNGAPSGASDPSGVIGGGYVGYNHQIGSFVVGVEADGQGSGVNGGYVIPTFGSSAGSTHMDWEAAFRARLGYAFDHVLLYAASGMAVGGFRYGGGPGFGAPIPCCGFSDTQTGITIGAGAEYAITDHVIGRVEYRYNQFSTSAGGLSPTYPGVTMSVNNDGYSEVRAGVAYKF
jgi:outer membrane immunogenic protein